MTDMIERVARAMAEDCGWTWRLLGEEAAEYDDQDECRVYWRDRASAAISAMREPTEEMKSAGRGQTDFADEAWSVMIHSALGGKK